MRADPANANDDANEPHEVGEGEGKGLWGALPKEAPQPIADASGRSRCDEGIGLPRLAIVLMPQGPPFAQPMQERVTVGGPH